MERRFKGLVAISDVLDDRYQKLSDRFENLKLSHNRKRKCLEWIRKEFTPPHELNPDYSWTLTIRQSEIEVLLKNIDDALWSDGRMRKKCTRQKKDSKSCLRKLNKKAMKNKK